MTTEKSEVNREALNIYVAISDRERRYARQIARKQGMTFQGWVGRLIRQEIERETKQEASNAHD